MQRDLARRVRKEGHVLPNAWIAGVDVHVRGSVGFAVCALVRLNTLETHETAVAEGAVTFPYVPGFLSFRELPLAAEAVRKLTQTPDVLLVDGQGVAHPRRLGLAAHLGLELDMPAIGCAKSRLYGTHDEPCLMRGCRTPLLAGEETVGVVLRTRHSAAPLYVSVGHRMSLEACVDVVLRCTPLYRIPIPLRLAHQTARQLASV